MRDGKLTEIDSEQVVPGDVLVLISGTKVAADGQVLQSIGLQVDESALTGESFPQDKAVEDEINAGTVVVSGEGLAVVRVTGKQTKLGVISESLKKVPFRCTPLQQAMRSLSGKLVYVAAFFSIAIPIIGIIRGQDIRTMVLTGPLLGFRYHPRRAADRHHDGVRLRFHTLSKNNF